MTEEMGRFISLVGTIVQLGSCVLLVILFALLRSHAVRRRYFRAWGKAWVALGLALLAVVVRYYILPWGARGPAPDAGSREVRLLIFCYQFGKLLFFALIVAGAAMYASGLRYRRFMPIAAGAAAAYAAMSAFLGADLNEMVAFQAPAAVAASGYCAWTLLALPPSRQSLGSRATGYCFTIIGALWVAYAAGFGYHELGHDVLPAPLALVVAYNSYFDLLLQTLAGYGMVLILMEDAKRQVDAAHAGLAIAHDELKRDALLDSVTGTFNRRAFFDGVGLDAARATFGTAVMADLDNLKIANDAYGHAAGDELLRHFARILRETLRASDRVYRLGGDEFLLLLPNAKPEDALTRVEGALERAEAVEVQGRRLRVLASVGAAAYAGSEDLAAAIERADAAMYRQKAQRKAPATLAATAAA
ncbi:MAG: GGDEF domain-containing protein [Gemmatimonadaceae bacterium]